MVRKMMLAVAAVALLAAPAFAAVQNVKVGGSLTTTAILDKNVVSGGVSSDVRGSDILAQTTLDVQADLTDNVSTNVGLINERLWGRTSSTADSAANTAVDLETAYVTFKEFLYSPLTLTVGRQPLAYGNSLVIGSNTFASNLPAAYQGFSKKGNFDAVKAVLSYNPLTVDLFASRIYNKNTAIAAKGNNDNINLYGLNANYKVGDQMNTVVEGYVFAKMDDSIKTYSAADNVKSQDTYVPGLRVSTNPIEGLNVQLEGAYEIGHINNNTYGLTPAQAQQALSAYAFQGIVNYALPVMKDMKPVVSAGYKYLSGDKVATGVAGVNQKTSHTWDPMFENQDNGRIYDSLGLSNTNVQLAKLGFEIAPMKDVTTALSLSGVWKAGKGAYADDATNSSKYLGSELDADVTYAYTEDVKIGLSAGTFLTGKNFLAPGTSAENNKNASQLLTSVSVAF
ncbi:MAG: alginate export family protein [Candidatus Omnitrophica bacterium]|nr:alginate export family protein [Candidatus Omnitrophota bacterium]